MTAEANLRAIDLAHSVPDRWLGGRESEEDGADWVGEPGALFRLSVE